MIESAGLTDAGTARESNEDAFLADPRSGVFLVADGMGGMEAGEMASRIAVETVSGHLPEVDARDCPNQAWSLEREVVLAFEEASDCIRRFALQGPGPAGTGVTLAGLVRCGDFFVLGSAGGARAYHIHAQHIRRLSGDLPPRQGRPYQDSHGPGPAARGPGSDRASRSLGMEPRLEVDTRIVPAESGDVFLLCSDGLNCVLADHELLEIVSQGRADSLQDICARFIALALDRKVRDNVTVVLVRCLP